MLAEREKVRKVISALLAAASISFAAYAGQDGETHQCGAGEISITSGEKGRIVYEDYTIRITITGGWESATESGGLITFNYPLKDRLNITWSTDDAWGMDEVDVDYSVSGGYAKFQLKCRSNEEETHDVELNFASSGELDLDLDCDADWDKSITDEDDPIEESIGGTVGYQKLDGIRIKVDFGEVVSTNCTVGLLVKGGIELCSTNSSGEVTTVVAAPESGKERRRTLKLEDALKINCVRGVAVSKDFLDCEVKATAKMPGGGTVIRGA